VTTLLDVTPRPAPIGIGEATRTPASEAAPDGPGLIPGSPAEPVHGISGPIVSDTDAGVEARIAGHAIAETLPQLSPP
jgi:hypothetical protein